MGVVTESSWGSEGVNGAYRHWGLAHVRLPCQDRVPGVFGHGCDL